MKLIYGSEINLVNFKLKEILSSYSNYQIVSFNNENTLEDLLNQLNQISLDIIPKVYVFKNVCVFENLESFDQQINILNQIMKFENEQIILTTTTKLSNANKIREYLSKLELITVEELNVKNLNIYLREILDKNNVNLDDELFQYLKQKLNLNIGIINYEVNKLIGYEFIDRNLIDQLICDWKEDNIFKLTEYIINNNITETFNLYEQLKNMKFDEVGILTMLANQFSKLLIIKKILASHSYESIIKKLKLNPYWLNNVIQLLTKISLNKLKYILNSIFVIDVKIKQNITLKDIIIKELFLNLLTIN